MSLSTATPLELLTWIVTTWPDNSTIRAEGVATLQRLALCGITDPELAVTMTRDQRQALDELIAHRPAGVPMTPFDIPVLTQVGWQAFTSPDRQTWFNMAVRLNTNHPKPRSRVSALIGG